MSGQGTVTDTTFTLTAYQVQSLTSNVGQEALCADAYGSFVNACTTYIETRGVWLDSLTVAQQDTICPDDDDSPFFPFPSPGVPTGP
jgi:hypothetical protein